MCGVDAVFRRSGFGVRGRTPRPRTLDVAKVSTTFGKSQFSAADSANKTEAKHRVIALSRTACVAHTLITFTRHQAIDSHHNGSPPARSHITGSRPSHFLICSFPQWENASIAPLIASVREFTHARTPAGSQMDRLSMKRDAAKYYVVFSPL